MSSSEEVLASEAFFDALSRFLNNKEFFSVGHLSRATRQTLLAHPRYSIVRRTYELHGAFPDYAYQAIFRTLREKYVTGIEHGFTGSLAPYNQSESMKDLARAALASLEALNQSHTVFGQTRQSRNVVCKSISHLKSVLSHRLPRSRSPFTAEQCLEEFASVERFPHIESLVDKLKIILNREIRLTPQENAVFFSMCWKSQTSLFADIYVLLDAIQKYYLLLNNPDAPVSALMRNSYVVHHGQVQSSARRIQQAQQTYQATFNLRYMIPIMAVMVGLLLYWHHHPTPRGQVSKPGLLLASITLFIALTRLLSLVFRDHNRRALEHLETVVLEEPEDLELRNPHLKRQ